MRVFVSLSLSKRKMAFLKSAVQSSNKQSQVRTLANFQYSWDLTYKWGVLHLKAFRYCRALTASQGVQKDVEELRYQALVRLPL